MGRAMRTISLAAGTVLDVGPAGSVDVAADADFPSVGIWFDTSTWTDTVADEVRRRAERRGIVILDIEPIMLAPKGSAAVVIAWSCSRLYTLVYLVSSLFTRTDAGSGTARRRSGAVSPVSAWCCIDMPR